MISISESGDHDVRFFGGSHSRAIVTSRNIRSIDTDLKSLVGTKFTESLKEALRELNKHKEKLKCPLSQFTFEVETEAREKSLHKNESSKKQVPKNAGKNRQSIEKTAETKRNSITTDIQENNKSFKKGGNSSATHLKPEAKSESSKNFELIHTELQIQNKNEKHKLDISNDVSEDTSPKRNKTTNGCLESNTSISKLKTTSFEEAISNIPIVPVSSPRIKRNLTKSQNPIILNLEEQLSKFQSVDEVKQAAIDVISKEITAWQGRIKQLKADHAQEIIKAKKIEWVSY